MRYILPFVLIVLSSCAAQSSGVVQDGPDTYTIIQSGRSGFTSSGSLRIQALQRAAEYCHRTGLQMQTIEAKEQRGGILGKFPEADIHFRCVKPQ